MINILPNIFILHINYLIYINRECKDLFSLFPKFIFASNKYNLQNIL
jgi:hypothetical protein